MLYAYKHSYESCTYVHQFDSSLTNVPKKANNRIYQARFLETITTYANRGPIIYTDGSKSVSEDRVASTIYSPDLNVALKFKLSSRLQFSQPSLGLFFRRSILLKIDVVTRLPSVLTL